jgi:hypothetical protein
MSSPRSKSDLDTIFGNLGRLVKFFGKYLRCFQEERFEKIQSIEEGLVFKHELDMVLKVDIFEINLINIRYLKE